MSFCTEIIVTDCPSGVRCNCYKSIVIPVAKYVLQDHNTTISIKIEVQMSVARFRLNDFQVFQCL